MIEGSIAQVKHWRSITNHLISTQQKITAKHTAFKLLVSRSHPHHQLPIQGPKVRHVTGPLLIANARTGVPRGPDGTVSKQPLYAIPVS